MFASLLIAAAGLMAWVIPGKQAKEEVKWISLKDAEAMYKKSPRPILIDLYTDWCGWCKVMDKQTYANRQVAAYINEKFYPVKLNAEQREAVVFNGRTYKFNSQYRTNEIAMYLTGWQLSYPTTVFIPAVGEQPQAVPGFLKPKDIEPIVKYFGEGQFGKTAFADFDKKLKKSW